MLKLITLISVLLLQNIVNAREGKIVGGENAPPGTYPWFVRLIDSDDEWASCGGTLVAPEFVLTAAHCVYPYNPYWGANIADTAVDIGVVCADNPTNCGTPMQKVGVEAILLHPDYDSGTKDNDFALVKLSSRAIATPVRMDDGQFVDNYSSTKRDLWAIGFGALYYFGSATNRLQHVELGFVSRDTCDNSYNGLGWGITSNMMCAADPNQDSCQGDSGGPLYDKTNDALVGVVSWGYKCAEEGYPGVYAQVSTQFSFLKDIICQNHSVPKPSFCSDSPATCPSNEFIGRTLLLPLGTSSCYRLELFPEGLVEVDNSNPNCLNAEFNSQGVISVFLGGDRDNIYFENNDGQLPFGGQFNFAPDTTVSGLAGVPNSIGGGRFDVTLKVPSCDMGPLYPCFYGNKIGDTVYVAVAGICLKIELFGAGTVSGDTSDQDCSKPVHTANIVVSTLASARGNLVYYESIGEDGWSGSFELNRDSSVSKVEAVTTVLDTTLRKFEIGLTFPSCSN